MEKIFIPKWLERLAQVFHKAGYELFLVGGALRDQLLGRELIEWDLATSALPDQTEKLLRANQVRSIGTIGKRFGTITGKIMDETIEITTYRGEAYASDSRQPIVNFGQTIKEDLSRRDFTINAMAYDIQEKTLIDFFLGQEDLKKKIIRAVGQPEIRFREDPLRMLRAVRFAVNLDFDIEPATKEGIRAEKARFTILSAERIAQELDKILLSPHPDRGIELLVELGIIDYILPELLPSINLEFDPKEHKDIFHHTLRVLVATEPQLDLRWLALLHDIAKPQTRKKIGNEYHFLGHEIVGSQIAKAVLTRLHYPNDFIRQVSRLVYLHQRISAYDPDWTDGAVRRFVRETGDLREKLFLFAEADCTGENKQRIAKYKELRNELSRRITKLEKEAEIAKIKSPLDGTELMKIFNRPAGAWIKPLKEHLLNLVLDGKLAADDKKRAEEIAREMLNSAYKG